ncbi:hypothetical protein [Salibacter halophilus]|uniref:Uncharacterized protein n=1 Tax=Salibacter halophilus TaxID=1803916 RepID=A0A6N6M7Q1_9FLAO|nr:hypothetical protein [Salibacter halophilus]KAB1066110.1 hypothetical protein F3059_01170 [Salibacter halophilus]
MKKLGFLFVSLFVFGVSLAQNYYKIDSPDIKVRKSYTLNCEEYGMFQLYLTPGEEEGDFIQNEGPFSDKNGNYYLYAYRYENGEKKPAEVLEYPLDKKNFRSKKDRKSLVDLMARFYFGTFKPLHFLYENGKMHLITRADEEMYLSSYDIESKTFDNTTIPVGFEFDINDVKKDDDKLFLSVNMKKGLLKKKVNNELMIVDLKTKNVKLSTIPVYHKYEVEHVVPDFYVSLNPESNVVGVLMKSGDGHKERTNFLMYDYDGKFINQYILPNQEKTSYTGYQIEKVDEGFFVSGFYRERRTGLFKSLKKFRKEQGFFAARYDKSGEQYFKKNSFDLIDFKLVKSMNGKFEMDLKDLSKIVICDDVAYMSFEFYERYVQTHHHNSGMAGAGAGGAAIGGTSTGGATMGVGFGSTSSTTVYNIEYEVAFVGVNIENGNLEFEKTINQKEYRASGGSVRSVISYSRNKNRPILGFYNADHEFKVGTVFDGEFEELSMVPPNSMGLKHELGFNYVPTLSKVHALENDLLMIELSGMPVTISDMFKRTKISKSIYISL